MTELGESSGAATTASAPGSCSEGASETPASDPADEGPAHPPQGPAAPFLSAAMPPRLISWDCSQCPTLLKPWSSAS